MGFRSQEARVVERFRIIEVAEAESVTECCSACDSDPLGEVIGVESRRTGAEREKAREWCLRGTGARFPWPGMCQHWTPMVGQSRPPVVGQARAPIHT